VDDVVNPPAPAISRFGPEAAERLRLAFKRSRCPMLIVDDHRRWVTGNDAACEFFAVAPSDIPWRTADEFTSPEGRKVLVEQWAVLSTDDGIEGWYPLYFQDRDATSVEFSVVSNVLPGRHLSVLIPVEDSWGPPPHVSPGADVWSVVTPMGATRTVLTDREREVMALVAAGNQGATIAENLFLSPETVKSHVQNAMAKLAAHTRAHAVAIALVTGQIPWESTH
jgi:DNA-binding CsgD family transcriptional regulator